MASATRAHDRRTGSQCRCSSCRRRRPARAARQSGTLPRTVARQTSACMAPGAPWHAAAARGDGSAGAVWRSGGPAVRRAGTTTSALLTRVPRAWARLLGRLVRPAKVVRLCPSYLTPRFLPAVARALPGRHAVVGGASFRRATESHACASHMSAQACARDALAASYHFRVARAERAAVRSAAPLALPRKQLASLRLTSPSAAARGRQHVCRAAASDGASRRTARDLKRLLETQARPRHEQP